MASTRSARWIGEPTLERCWRGDRAALDTFVDVYKANLWACGQCKGIPKTVLADLVQSTLELAIECFIGEAASPPLTPGQPEKQVFAVLRGVLWNKWCSYCRRSQSWTRVANKLPRLGPSIPPEREPRALQALEELNPVDRAIVSMRVIEDYSHEEIACLLECIRSEPPCVGESTPLRRDLEQLPQSSLSAKVIGQRCRRALARLQLELEGRVELRAKRS